MPDSRLTVTLIGVLVILPSLAGCLENEPTGDPPADPAAGAAGDAVEPTLPLPNATADREEPTTTLISPATAFVHTLRVVAAPAGSPAAGAVYAAWSGRDNTTSGLGEPTTLLFASKSPGEAEFSAPLAIPGFPENTFPLDLAAPGDGRVIALVTVFESTEDHLAVVRSDDGGASWHPPTWLSGRRLGVAPGGIAVDGDLVLVGASRWTGEPLRMEPLLFRSLDGGASFGEPIPIPVPDGLRPTHFPRVLVGEAGVVHALMSAATHDMKERATVVAVSLDGGASFEGAHRADGVPDPAAVAGSPDEPALLVQIYPRSGQRPPGYVVMTRGEDGGFAASEPINASGVRFDMDSCCRPGIAREGDVVVAAWHQYDPATQALELGYAVSRDGGRSFGPAGLVTSQAHGEKTAGDVDVLLVDRAIGFAYKSGDLLVLRTLPEPSGA